MIYIAPDQEVYDAVYGQLQAAGLKPQETRPSNFAKVELPMVYLGQTQQLDGGTKTSLNPDIALTIAVWGNKQQRYEVSQLCARLFSLLSMIHTTEHLSISLRRNQTSRTVAETKQDELDLWQGLIDVTYHVL